MDRTINFHDSDFTVVPQYLILIFKHHLENWYATLIPFRCEIHLKNQLILITQLKDPSAISHLSTRVETEDQIRRRMGDESTYIIIVCCKRPGNDTLLLERGY